MLECKVGQSMAANAVARMGGNGGRMYGERGEIRRTRTVVQKIAIGLGHVSYSSKAPDRDNAMIELINSSFSDFRGA